MSYLRASIRVVFFIVLLVSMSDIASADTVNLPKTGQTLPYHEGDDGNILAGTSWPHPRFMDNGDGTITDNLTGLMWLKDINCYPSGMSWTSALHMIDNLNYDHYQENCQEYTASYSDWRIPNINELQSLINDGVTDLRPWFAQIGFVRTFITGDYWTSTTYAESTDMAWVFDYDYGATYPARKDQVLMLLWPVRTDTTVSPVAPVWQTGQTVSYDIHPDPFKIDDGALRRGVAWPNPRFTNPDGTTPITDDVVVDQLTGLMWLKDANCIATNYPNFDNDQAPGDGEVTWDHALIFIEGVNNNIYPNCGGGYNDWRLPNINELRSLIDYSQYRPALPSGHPFLNVNLETFDVYYSSTTNQAHGRDHALAIDMSDGGIGQFQKDLGAQSLVWPVRGGTTGFTFMFTSDMRYYLNNGQYREGQPGGTPPRFDGALQSIKTNHGGGDFMISPGDIDGPVARVYETITGTGTLGSDYQWYPVIGNHELPGLGNPRSNGINMAWLRNYIPTLPNIVNWGPVGGTRTTYSFDYGNSHFAVLNEYYNGTNDDTGANSSGDCDVVDGLYNWLQSDLDDTRNNKPYIKHIFVTGHAPAYPQPDEFTGRSRGVGFSLDQHDGHRNRFWNLLRQKGVLAYLTAHTHDYSAVPIDGVWQLDPAHSRGDNDPGGRSTFIKIDAQGGTATFKTYRDYTLDGNSSYTLDNPNDPSDLPRSGALTDAPTAGFFWNSKVFQDGVVPWPSYYGTRDTYISGNEPNNNFGGTNTVKMDGATDLKTLLRWDISAIPEGSTIGFIAVTVDVTNESNQTYELYEMLQDWNESQVTWNNVGDRDSTVLGTITAMNAGIQSIPLNAAGIAAVQSWVDNSSTNYGIMIEDITNTDDLVAFSSREGSFPPLLTVMYRTQTSIPDADEDGVSDQREGSGDWDGDGIPDFQDPDTTRVYTATGAGQIVVDLPDNSARLRNVSATHDEDYLLDQQSKPTRKFPFGLLKMDITDIGAGETVTATLEFPDNVPTHYEYWKYDTTNGWYQIPFGSNDGDNTITITLTDGPVDLNSGRYGDGDNIADGTIRDFGGLSAPKPEIVNDIVTFNRIRSTYETITDATGCTLPHEFDEPAEFAGQFSFDARLTNKSNSPLSELVVEVAELTDGNFLRNAHGGPGGVGARLTVPSIDDYADGVLESGESVNVHFVICLTEIAQFRFVVDVLGVKEAGETESKRLKFRKGSRAAGKKFFGRFSP